MPGRDVYLPWFSDLCVGVVSDAQLSSTVVPPAIYCTSSSQGTVVGVATAYLCHWDITGGGGGERGREGGREGGRVRGEGGREREGGRREGGSGGGGREREGGQ